MIRFEWDASKARSNLRKHGISFDDAMRVFNDPHVLTTRERVVEGEQRWQTIGVVENTLLVLLVAHTWEEHRGEELMRLISARRATRKEQNLYEQNRKQDAF